MKHILSYFLLFGLFLANANAQTPDTIKITSQKTTLIIDTLNRLTPEFPGGLDSMYAFIYRNMKYPELASDNRIEGDLRIGFWVETDGSITNLEHVGKRIGWTCDEEAIRLFKLMPKWIPAMENGAPIRTRIVIPVFFRL
ncbi:MAG: hypothetical protein CFE21_15765 [Bacteroidetes bacterium B1(2017)]|nr:MAG: hypothetical protein CFE21_15765 [Bacteroidetes bacterium B1(2017)]